MTMRIEHLSDSVTLYCGDCLEVMPALGKVDAVVTDPPYGMEFRSNHRAVRHERIANDGDAGTLQTACAIPARHSSYIFCRWNNLSDVPQPRSVVTWVKNNWSMGDLEHEHARQTEMILFYPGPDHFFPRGRPQDIVHAPRTGNEFHPTEKPVGLMCTIVSWTAGTVLDPYCGSGSTLVACAKLGRSGIGIEIDEGYFDIACKRIENELRQPRFDLEPPPKPQQQALGLE